MKNVKDNFNNIKLIKRYLIELETSRSILNNEIQNQKESIIILEKKEEEEEKKKHNNKNLVNYIICCFPFKLNN